MNKDNQNDISVVVTCHAEGIILHKTLLAIKRAVAFAEKKDSSFKTEVIIHADNPTPDLKEYLRNYLKPVQQTVVYENSFGGPGQSRDFCIKKATGKYTAFIDGDDIMSENWLWASYRELQKRPYGSAVAHSEMTVEFNEKDVALVKKYAAIDKKMDALLNVLSGRWNSVIVAPTNILKEMGYPHDKDGYGFEDWLISCQLIYKGVDNVLIPETVIFVRRKDTNSIWDEHRRNMTVLPANKLLSFENIRNIKPSNSQPHEAIVSSPVRKQVLKQCIKKIAQKTRTKQLILQGYQTYLAIVNRSSSTDSLPQWLLTEWHNIHAVERQLFPPDITNLSIFQSLTKDHYDIGYAYHQLVAQTKHNSYDYALFVPWLSKGGADLFAINYANSIASIVSNKRVMVVATDPNQISSWQHKLSSKIDFVDFSPVVAQFSHDHQNKILEQFIENSGATHLHILNSVSGYDFVRNHKKYIKESKKSIIATSFSQSVDDTGRTFGFSHTHVPYVYDQLSMLTTDNQVVVDMWAEDYGFDTKKITVHRQPVSLQTKPKRTTKHSEVRILWAARLAPEKIPGLVPEIAHLLPENYYIDMYGEPGADTDMGFLKSLPSNIRYLGPFDGFSSLPTDDYDLYLYTSIFDGLPNVLFEASDAGLPIIASAIGGVPEFLADNCGILIKDTMSPQAYAEAIIGAKSENMYKDRVENARKKIATQYSNAQYTEAIEKMLKYINYTQ